MFKQMIMFAASLASRGLNNNKIDLPTKQLRVLSCFGGLNGIERCPNLKVSKSDSTKHYCNGCGCGDKKHTWLIQHSTEYSKLDYPVLNCPLKMPGFSNYDPNFTTPDTKERKQKVEDIDPSMLSLIQVTIGHSEEKEKLIDQMNKIVRKT